MLSVALFTSLLAFADPAPVPAPEAEPTLFDALPGLDPDTIAPDVKAVLETLDEPGIQALLDRDAKGEPLTEAERSAVELLVAEFGKQFAAEFDRQVEYRTGDIALGDGLAVLHLGESFRFLDGEDAQKVLVDAWGNPPGDVPLGMIVPADLSPATPQGWGVVVSYVEEGHVDDEDAEDIDYAELLEEMQAATEAENEARKTQGYAPLHLVGWAEPPHYDPERKSLYWAKELSVDDNVGHSLNYAIRVLGRKGVLELNAVAGMDMLADIKPQMERIYEVVEFNQGNRYADFDPELDQVAAYGIGGLIAGKVALKTGFFAVLLKGLLAAKKLVLVGVIALGAGVKALFGLRKSKVDDDGTTE